MSKLILGIDTSNYKTSVALTDLRGEVHFQRSDFLEVEQGERGLRQSVAFFRHVHVLPSFIEEAMHSCSEDEIAALAVSDAPRRAEGSYMPVFMAGLQTARSMAAVLRVPLYRYSHQEGHIAAVCYGENPERYRRSLSGGTVSDFAESQDDSNSGRQQLFFHLSGGTTECLLVKEQDRYHYLTEIVGGTKDISLGQLLDRAGVKLGYPFPAGKYLDRIASEKPVTERPGKIKTTEGYFNLSGTEFQVMKSIDEKGDAIIPGLFQRIGELLLSAASELAEKYHVEDVTFAGGVASSATVRTMLAPKKLPKGMPKIHFGSPTLSGDNAVGIALLGGREYYGHSSDYGKAGQ